MNSDKGSWKRRAKRLVVPGASVCALCAGAVGLSACGSGSAGGGSSSHGGSTSKVKIAFAQSFLGNGSQATYEALFKASAQALVKYGYLASYTIQNGNNSPTTQASQIESDVLKGYSAIVVEPTSSTALDGAIADAEKAHIPVISVQNGDVSSAYPYEVQTDLVQGGYNQGKYIATRLHGVGNVIDVRGIAGVSANNVWDSGVEKALSEYPKIKVVARPYGQWAAPDTASAVAGLLHSLPKVNGVVTQGGGEEYGVVEAFKAAHLPLPIVTGALQGQFLNWWAKARKATGYSTISQNGNGWYTVGLAPYIAVDVLKGVTIPHDTSVPFLTVTDATIEKWGGISPFTIAVQPPAQCTKPGTLMTVVISRACTATAFQEVKELRAAQ